MSAHGLAALLGLNAEEFAWMASGACLGMDPTLFFPGRGESHKPALDVCRGCPVRQDCLDYALDNRIKFGVWGATTERQRRSLRRARPARDAA